MKAISEDFKYRMRIIGDNFREVRTARKLSLQAVSRALKIPEGRLGDIEKGEYDMEFGLLIDLCHYYDVRAGDVISEDFKYPIA